MNFAAIQTHQIKTDLTFESREKKFNEFQYYRELPFSDVKRKLNMPFTVYMTNIQHTQNKHTQHKIKKKKEQFLHRYVAVLARGVFACFLFVIVLS